MTKTANRVLTPEAMARMQMRLASSNYVESAGLLMQWNIAVSALSDKSLSNSQKRVLGAILTVSENSSGQAMINRDVISMMTGLSQQVVSNCVTTLQKLRYIEVFRASNGQGQGTASVYQLYGMTDAEIEAYTSTLEAAQAEMLDVATQPDRPDTANLSRDITKSACDERQMELTHMVSCKSVTSPNRLAVNGNITNEVSCKSQHNDIGDVTHAGAHVARVHGRRNNIKEKNKQKKKAGPRSRFDVPADVIKQFEEFWTAFPKTRRGGKDPALLMFWDLIEGQFVSNPADGAKVAYASVSAATLIHCAKCYSSSLKDLQYASGVQSWFNGGKWQAFEDWETADKPKFRLVTRADGTIVRKPIGEGER